MFASRSEQAIANSIGLAHATDDKTATTKKLIDENLANLKGKTQEMIATEERESCKNPILARKIRAALSYIIEDTALWHEISFSSLLGKESKEQRMEALLSNLTDGAKFHFGYSTAAKLLE